MKRKMVASEQDRSLAEAQRATATAALQNDMKKMESLLRAKNLQPHKPFMTKVIELFETFIVRFGVMLVGYTGAGKTKCYETLSDIMNTLRAENHPD